MDNGSRSSLKPFKRDASEAMTGQTSSVPSPPQRPRKKNRNSISQAEEEEAKARGYLKHAEFLARNLEPRRRREVWSAAALGGVRYASPSQR